MLPCSKPGHLYGIDVESVNVGIPYADSFSVMVHYCLQRVSDKESSLSVYAHISYRKSVWGLVKGNKKIDESLRKLFPINIFSVDRNDREKLLARFRGSLLRSNKSTSY